MQQRTLSLLLVGLAVAVGAVVLLKNREDSPQLPVTEVANTAPAATVPVVDSAPDAATPAAATVPQLIADATGGDAAKRAAAITALAAAPRAQAVPVLRRILTDGEPQVDRTLALRSLRDLALNQGDADGIVREAVRNAIYHGDDQMKMDEVQEVLDIIEESEQR